MPVFTDLLCGVASENEGISQNNTANKKETNVGAIAPVSSDGMGRNQIAEISGERAARMVYTPDVHAVQVAHEVRSPP